MDRKYGADIAQPVVVRTVVAHQQVQRGMPVVQVDHIDSVWLPVDIRRRRRAKQRKLRGVSRERAAGVVLAVDLSCTVRCKPGVFENDVADALGAAGHLVHRNGFIIGTEMHPDRLERLRPGQFVKRAIRRCQHGGSPPF